MLRLGWFMLVGIFLARLGDAKRAKKRELKRHDNIDKEVTDKDEAQRENQEPFGGPVGGPVAVNSVNPVGGFAPQSVQGGGLAGVIPNEAAQLAVKDGRLQQKRFGGLLNEGGGTTWTDSKEVTTWPGNAADGLPIKLKEKVRNLVNNDVGTIVALTNSSGQKSLKFRSDKHGELPSWLQPSDISHDVSSGHEYIPPHQGRDEHGRIYKEGDEVIVTDPKKKSFFERKGVVGSHISGNHDDGTMRVDFGGLGALGPSGWFEPKQLKHAN